MSPSFIKEFSELLKGIRTLLKGGEDSQPVVLSGSGTLGWDVIVSNLCEKGDHALVINTGYFSDSYAVCAENYGVKVHQVKCENVGDTVSESQLEKYLSSQTAADIKYKLICITQVDTSTAVVNDVAALARTAKKHQPDALISVDGVCSFGGEKFHFDEWGIDAGMSCSQKALGAPPGLSVLLFSKRALQSFESRDTTVASYYANLHNWLPIMRSHEQLKPSYFGTPNVNLIRAMNVSIQQLLKYGVDKLIDQHITKAKKFRAAMKALNLKFVATAPEHSANTLSAVYYPAGLKREAFLPAALKRSVVLAGGLHKDIKPDYFRVGHMGYSVWGDNDFMEKTVEAIEGALIEAGADVKEGTAIKAYESANQKSAA